MKIKQLFALMILLSMTFAACTKDDDDKKEEETPSKSKHEMLYDKMWYNLGQGRGDHYFNSDGTCTWSLVAGQGSWEWKPNDSLKVSFPGYTDQVFHMLKIEEKTMEYWPTSEPEANIYKFSDTQP
jgi:hypothetical protein